MVLIASAKQTLRQHWATVLKSGFRVVEVSSRAALEGRLAEQPFMLLLHMHLPRLRGLEGVSDIRRLSPATRIILLTSSPDEKEEILALKLGIRGYCREDIPSSLLKRAVHAVAQDEIWIGRRVIPWLLDEIASGTREPDNQAAPRAAGSFDGLSARKTQIALLVADGLSNKEICSRLNISESTVKAHLTAIFRYFGITHRLQLALLVAEHYRPSIR